MEVKQHINISTKLFNYNFNLNFNFRYKPAFVHSQFTIHNSRYYHINISTYQRINNPISAPLNF